MERDVAEVAGGLGGANLLFTLSLGRWPVVPGEFLFALARRGELCTQLFELRVGNGVAALARRGGG